MDGIRFGATRAAMFRISTATLIASLALAMALRTPSRAADANPGSGDGLGTATAADWWSIVQRDIRASEYHVTWQEQTYLNDVAAAYQAPNRAQGLRTYFTPTGPIVIPREWDGDGAAAETALWRWEMGLTAWGRGPALQAVGAAILHVQDNLIEYRRDGIVEAYRNAQDGIAQTFRLDRPAASRANQDRFDALTLELAYAGDLAAQWRDGARAVEFVGDGDAALLRYGDLTARDAAGQRLSVRFEREGTTDGAGKGTMRIVVDDAGAVYPVEIELAITGLSDDPDWEEGGGQSGSQFGYAVATAGDVNCDGYSDVIVGAPNYDHGQAEEGRAYVYRGSGGGLLVSPSWAKESDQAEAHFGWSVATAGDVNGDQCSDVIVGAPDYSNGQDGEGGAWVYHGDPQGLETSPANFDEGNQAGASFGYIVATAGDVNGDQYSDIIVGAPYYDNGQNAEGRVWVWHGSADGVVENHNWRAESNQEYGHFGISAATAGDVNGDGYADIIVGSSGYSNGQSEEGAAFVWHGSADGVNNDVNGDPGNAEWMGQSNQAGARFGRAVSTAGDVNGDGYADVIVGAHLYSNGQDSEGGAWVFLGSSSGLSNASDNQDEGNQTNAMFGYSVATAGDVNGDGYADVIVGAPNFTNGEFQEGRAWVWHGSPDGISESRDWDYEGNEENARFGISVATAGDVDGDGYSDVIIGAYEKTVSVTDEGAALVFYGAASTLAEEPGWTKASNKLNAFFGWSVRAAGDVNGDGWADIVVGAPGWDGGQQREGGAWIYHGTPSGPDPVPAWHVESDTMNASYGHAVDTAGDVNGDGYSDVIVGAPDMDNGESGEGLVFVYHGSSSGLGTSAAWTKDSDHEDAQFGFSVGTAGDVNGDGYADVIVGSPKYSSGGEIEEGFAFVYHGSESGLISAPAWSRDSDQRDAHLGVSVGTAGDVNRDGYSDIIVGAPDWNGDIRNEGGAWVHLGSKQGVKNDPAWYYAGPDVDTALGAAVGTAGDVNGDGFADVIVGAPYLTNGQTQEGGAFVFHGRSSGLATSPMWSKESNNAHALYGVSVGTAGDVNGDGYADIIVGAPGWTDSLSEEGGAWVYHGSPAGAHSAPDWYTVGGQEGSEYGWSVSTAGDVNADGYAEVVVGAPRYQRAVAAEGQVFMYYGNGGAGVPLKPRQMRPASPVPLPIAHMGRSPAEDLFWLTILIRSSPYGRGRMTPEFQVAPLGTSLQVGTIYQTTTWYNPTATGVILLTPKAMTGLSPGTVYHWRARLRYQPATVPFQPFSRWVTIPWNGWNEGDLRTDGTKPTAVFLPLVVHGFE